MGRERPDMMRWFISPAFQSILIVPPFKGTEGVQALPNPAVPVC